MDNIVLAKKLMNALDDFVFQAEGPYREKAKLLRSLDESGNLDELLCWFDEEEEE